MNFYNVHGCIQAPFGKSKGSTVEGAWASEEKSHHIPHHSHRTIIPYEALDNDAVERLTNRGDRHTTDYVLSFSIVVNELF